MWLVVLVIHPAAACGTRARILSWLKPACLPAVFRHTFFFFPDDHSDDHSDSHSVAQLLIQSLTLTILTHHYSLTGPQTDLKVLRKLVLENDRVQPLLHILQSVIAVVVMQLVVL